MNIGLHVNEMSLADLLGLDLRADRWMARGTCRDHDMDLPYGGPEYNRRNRAVNVRTQMALEVCNGDPMTGSPACPVRGHCLARALDTGEAYGVWGGLDEDQRKLLGKATDWPVKADDGGAQAEERLSALDQLAGRVYTTALAEAARLAEEKAKAAADAGDSAESDDADEPDDTALPDGMRYCALAECGQPFTISSKHPETRFCTITCANQTPRRPGQSANALKTHCKNGHEYTPDNTSQERGRRVCLTCRRGTRARNKQRRAEAAAEVAVLDGSAA